MHAHAAYRHLPPHANALQGLAAVALLHAREAHAWCTHLCQSPLCSIKTCGNIVRTVAVMGRPRCCCHLGPGCCREGGMGVCACTHVHRFNATRCRIAARFRHIHKGGHALEDPVLLVSLPMYYTARTGSSFIFSATTDTSSITYSLLKPEGASLASPGPDQGTLRDLIS